MIGFDAQKKEIARLLSIAACLLATAVPLRKIAKLSIVDSIETVE